MRFPFGFRRKEPSPPVLPEFYVQVRDYVEAIMAGLPQNETFEAQSLSANGFTSLGLALVLLGIANRHGVPGKRLENFLRVGVGEGPDPRLPTLVQRATILQEGKLNEAEIYMLLDTGVVGDRKEIHDLNPVLDDVGFVMKMGHVVRDLQNETVFDDV